MPLKDLVQRREYMKKYREKHPDKRKRWQDPKQKAWMKKYREKHREKLLILNKKWNFENRVEQSIKKKKIYNRYRMDILIHYSNGVPQCACCGELEYEFLTIDHIAGGGRKHTTTIRMRGNNFYRYLILNNFPDGYQILCMNCNHAIGRQNSDGVCPHQKKKSLKIPSGVF